MKQLIKTKYLLSLGVSLAIALLLPMMQASTMSAPNYKIEDLGSQYRVDWVGNSFPGTKIISNDDRRHVQQEIEDIFVTPEGIVYTNSVWDERFAQASAYQDGKQTVIMDKMLGWGRKGGYAVTADDNYVYVAVQEGNIGRSRINRYGQPVYPQAKQVWYSVRRYNAKTGKIAGFSQGHGVDGGSIVVNVSGGHIKGLAIDRQLLYVSDTANNKIKVYDLNNLSQQPIDSWSVDNPGKLAFDLNGNLWVVQHQTNQVISFSPDGDLQKSITLPQNSVASDIAVDNQNQLLITDIGEEQIKIYENIATQPQYKSSIGEIGGILAADSKFAPLKFYQPKGVGTDRQENIYVAQDAWASVGGGGAIIESYKPDLSLGWRVYSLEFMSSLDIDSAEKKLYSKERVYRFNRDRKPGQTTTYEGITLNPQQFPDDPRIHDHFTGVELHYLAQKPILFMLQRMGRSIALYRFDKENYGETAIPYGMFYTVRPKDLKWNTHQPKNKEWIWIDKNLNGQFDKNEFTVNPLVKKETYPTTTGWYIEENGTIWTVAKTIIRKFSPIESETGYPIWDFANYQEFDLPNPLLEARRALYDSATDSMYLTGYTQDAPYTGEWKAIGKAIARFDNWSSSPTLKWIRETPWYYNNNSPREKPIAIDIAGDYVFIGLGSTGKQNSINKQSTVFVYDKAQGNYIGSMQHNGKVAPIMLDKATGLNAKKTANGEYLIFLEDAAYARSIIFHWNPN